MGNTYMYMVTFLIPSVAKANHKMGFHWFRLISPVRGEITVLAAWVVWFKEI